MESTIRQNSSIKHELDVTLTREELEPYFTTVFKEAQKNVSMKGYRKGHVPLTLIKKMYGASLEGEAVEEAVQQEFSKTAQKEELRPIGTPSITHIHRTEDGGLHFTVSYEVMPEITLGEYKGLPARKIFHVVEESEVQEELERVRENFATLEPAEQITDDNHTVVIDLQRNENGELVADNAMRDVRLYLRRPDVNPDLKASLLNTKVDDTFTIDLPTGENQEMNTYEVTVKEIQKVVLPELDDELAHKAIGEEATFDDLQGFIRQGIEGEYERRYSGYFRDELINAVLDRHDFEVPDTFVVEVLRSFTEDVKKDKKLPKDFNQEEFNREMRPTAEKTAKWALIRELIIEKEDLRADDPDYEGLADIEAQRTGIDYETLLNYFKKSDKIRDRILAEKSMQLLEDYAVVQEVEDKEMMAQEAQAMPADAGAEQTEG
jgi:trigger factor